MKDAKGHGSDARGGNGQFQSHVVGTGAQARTINATKERLAMRAMVDRRTYLAARTSNRFIAPPALRPNQASLSNPNARQTAMDRTDMPHHRGVDAATLGKKLGG